MNPMELALLLAALLCALTAGFVFAFATVIMPGIGKLDDRAFLRAFQLIDGVIQSGQLVFGLVWIGSVVAVLAAAAMAAFQSDSLERVLVVSSAIVYVSGVQVPTFAINVPLNNRLQSLDAQGLDDQSLASARLAFEDRWVRWNLFRTWVACVVSAVLMFVLLGR